MQSLCSEDQPHTSISLIPSDPTSGGGDEEGKEEDLKALFVILCPRRLQTLLGLVYCAAAPERARFLLNLPDRKSEDSPKAVPSELGSWRGDHVPAVASRGH